MSWFPIGPDFVFSPRNGNFKRLSRRNELGRQGFIGGVGQIGGLAIDQADPDTIYVVERPSSGGSTAFRTRTGGVFWTPITDSLQQSDANIDPNCIVINPVHPNIIYLGTWNNRGVFVSDNRGDTWGTRNAINGKVRKLIVDPRTAATPATTVLYAATDDGVYCSPDGGASWTKVVDGNVRSLVAHMPTTGTAHFYAGIWKSGVFHATDPTGTWTNLNDAGIGLPAHTAATTTEPDGNFNAILIDYCRRNPDRLYVWMTKKSCNASGGGCRQVTAALYTTSAPLTSWSQVSMTGAPGPSYGFYNFLFGVASNSPGDGSNDVLFFGSIGVHRSIDGGQTWEGAGDGFHADQHAIGFFPESPAAGVIPATYIGNDGGLSMSTKFADPAYTFASASTDFNEDLSYTNSGVPQNLNHGKQSSAVYQYASHANISALGYIGCQDTGVNGGNTALGWRGLADADAGAIAATSGADGVIVWGVWGSFGGWAAFRMHRWLDKGEYTPGLKACTLGSGGSLLATKSNYIVGVDNNCLAGTTVRDSEGTLTTAVAAAGSQTVTPSTMSGILVGTVLIVDTGPDRKLSAAITATGVQTATPTDMGNIVTGSTLLIDKDANEETVTVTATTATTFTANFTKTHAVDARVRVTVNEETVTVTAVTATTFTANFAKAHPGGVAFLISRDLVVRVGHDGIGAQISQDFGQNNRRVTIVAAHPTDADILYCATNDQRLWMTNSGSTASASTVWTEITGGKPASLTISSMTIDPAGNVYVLLRQPVSSGTGEFSTSTPLFKIVGNNWQPQECVALPTGFNFGKLVADPVQPDTLYAGHGARVYNVSLSSTSSAWTWQDISVGLPGQWIYDLWIGNIGTAEEPKVLLRAAIPTRAVWEMDVTAEAESPSISLYVRDNILDQGRLLPSPAGVPNPYKPTTSVRHYHCADLKLDSRQPASGSTAPFYQTDPEASTLPITHVLFDQLKDHSSNLPGGNRALVHVQVRNRSQTPANNVRVWAIYCNAAAGVPALNTSPSTGHTFDFWSQFLVTGQIVPNLPADSPWKAIGSPRTLSGIDAANPQVASWDFLLPLLPSGDPGHYCVAVFIHAAVSPVNETSMDVDYITPRSRQVGQKNLHIGPPLPASGEGGGGGGDEPGGQPAAPMMREYVEFHNPTAESRETTLRIDLSQLPSSLKVSFRLTPLQTSAPLQDSISGVDNTRQPGVTERLGDFIGRIFRSLGWFIQWLGCKLENLGRLLLKLPKRPCRRVPEVKLPRFEQTIYEAAPSAVVEISGIQLQPYGHGTVELTIENEGTLEPGSEYEFEVQQVVKGAIAGGSTYVVRIAGVRELKSPYDFPSLQDLETAEEIERREREGEESKFVPPWAQDIVEEREREQGKKD